MPKLDVTKLKVAIDRRPEVNPMRTLIGISATSVVLIAMMWGQSAQNSAVPLSDTDIQLLRSDLRADADKIVADTMQFTESESSAFWPVYRNYARDQQLIGEI